MNRINILDLITLLEDYFDERLMSGQMLDRSPLSNLISEETLTAALEQLNPSQYHAIRYKLIDDKESLEILQQLQQAQFSIIVMDTYIVNLYISGLGILHELLYKMTQ
jgi:hypothetical protein